MSFDMRIPILAFVGLALAGCNETLPKVQVSVPNIPSELRKCVDAPRTPSGNITQRDVATYTVKLGGAYVDCKKKLSEVDNLLKDYENGQSR